MRRFDLSSPKGSIYLVGIGGIGMSALARYLIAQGWTVLGSDSQKSTLTDELIKEGVKVKIGQKKGNIRPRMADFAVYNRAIRHDNPEMVAIRGAGIPLIPYAEALGEITAQYETIAITGSHGKSTTTALVALMLIRAGLDPTVLIGTKLKDLDDRNVRVGNGKYLVLEADDYQAAFLNYFPSIAIVTNIDREHMDFYKSFANVQRAFLKFLGKTRRGGTLILNKDDRPLFALRPKIAALAAQKSLKVIWCSLSQPAAKKIRRDLILPGTHNASNALAVYALGRQLRITEAKILRALHSYRGAWRRMEYRGAATFAGRQVKIFDDYAHHPSEIRATIAAFREKFPRAPLFIAFEPHQAKRLEALFKDFQSAFDEASAVWIAPIYKVPGRDEKTRSDSAALVRAMQKRAPDRPIFYLENLTHLPHALHTILSSPLFSGTSRAILVMMGAGSIVDSTGTLLEKPRRGRM